MKQYLLLRFTFAIGMTSLLLAGLTGIELQAQTAPDASNEGVEASVAWNKPEKFDTGMQSQAAINSSGMVVEVHRSESNYKAWYHVGRLTQYGQSVNWGKSHPVEVAGRSPRDKQVFPTVALTNDNFVTIDDSA